MIKVQINNNSGKLEVLMADCSPTIYLDHWALCDISESGEYSARLIEAVRTSGGTLAVSGFNLAEFIRMTNTGQAQQVENLLESILPHILFLDSNPFLVVERENTLMHSGPGRAPHIDYDWIKIFMGLKPVSLGEPFTVRGLFTIVQSAGLTGNLDHMCDTIASTMEQLRSEVMSDPALKGRVESPLRGSPIQRGTRYVLREIIRNHLRDRRVKFTRNHAIDLMHTVVPVAYCDMVLLDGHWCTRVAQAEKRIRAAGLTFPMAECFNGKGDGVNRFLTVLEQCVTSGSLGGEH